MRGHGRPIAQFAESVRRKDQPPVRWRRSGGPAVRGAPQLERVIVIKVVRFVLSQRR